MNKPGNILVIFLLLTLCVPYIQFHVRVMFFSLHRYEKADFWPHLKESNYDHIGTGAGTGYNINIPWNKVGAW